jgi:hypothetical protein
VTWPGLVVLVAEAGFAELEQPAAASAQALIIP